MIRKIMFDECNDENLGHVGQAIFDQRKQDGPAKLVHEISAYYVNLIKSCVAPKNGRVYSPFERGFYETKTKEPSIQDYTTPIELQALCRLLGPGGVRVLDYEMIKLSVRSISEIKTVLVANNVMVTDENMDASSGAKWDKISKTFRFLERLTEHSILFGLILCFRKELRSALSVVAKEKTPFMAQSVHLIHQRLVENGVIHNKFNQMSLDFGVVSAFSDNIINTIVVEKLKEDTKSPDEEMQYYRRAIPVLFGFLFTNNAWKNVYFHVPTGALSNNGLCIAHTLQLLLDAVSPLNRRKEYSRQLKINFLKYAALTQLNMNTSQFRQQYSAHKVRDLFCFLDYFVRLDSDLRTSDLEQAGVPYAMIRSQYVRLYGDANDITKTEGLVGLNQEEEVEGRN